MNRKEATSKNAAKWRVLIDDWLSSGLSGAKWCHSNNVSYNAFLYWRTKLTKEAMALPKAPAPVADPDETLSFFEIGVWTPSDQSDSPSHAVAPAIPAVELTLQVSGYSILVHHGVTGQTLATVMEVLSHA